MIHSKLIVPGFLMLALLGAARPSSAEDSCAGASSKIQSIVDADQAERQAWDKKTPVEVQEAQQRDTERRVQIAEIFARGCFKTGDDYKNAALVFQHGTVPDHFYQAYLWAMRATEMGVPGADTLAAMGADRWLMDRGYRQIYATQANSSTATHGCWCLWPVEKTSTDEDRRKMGRKPLAQQMAWIDSMNTGKSCPKASFCSDEAKSVTRGSLPGIAW